MTPTELAEAIAIAAATADYGTASARKTGRDSRWPYVPIVMHGDRQSQILGVAFATRAEALDFAERHVELQRNVLARQLAAPRFRALREQHGLPRELAR